MDEVPKEEMEAVISLIRFNDKELENRPSLRPCPG